MDVSASATAGGVTERLTDLDSEGIEPKEPSVSTMLMNFSNDFDPYGATDTPLYQTATFKQPSAIEYGPYDYTRGGNPTRDALERILEKLDNSERAFCFTSGMAALSAVSNLVGAGEEIVAGDDIHGGSDRLFSQLIPKKGITVKRVDMSNLDHVASAITNQTKLVRLESPINPRQQICDICRITVITHAHGALLLVDNSIMSHVWLLSEEKAWQGIYIFGRMHKAQV